MSATSGIAVHNRGRAYGSLGSLTRPHPERAEHRERSLARLATFTALAVYGVLRWATLVSPAPGSRLLGLLALAVTVAAVGPRLDARSRPLAVCGAIGSLLAMLMICGIPASWLLHARVAIILQGVQEGISALPGVLVPYIGINEWVRLVIVLGAGVLLLSAALMIAFAPRSLGDLRRLGAALPLVALAVIPSTIARPRLPYLHGLILFALLMAFLWSERTAVHHIVGAVALAGVAGALGVALAPGLDTHHPWINYNAIASNLSATDLDTFDWHQTYGPLNWPEHGRTVLHVRAARPDYWKSEDLDLFDGVAWAQGAGLVGSQLPSPAPWAVKRWTQTLEVTVRAMKSSNVIAAGTASEPQHVGEGVVPGISAGTWTAGAPLSPGDSYTVSTYSPRPDAAQLTAISARVYLASYPASDFADELTIALPTNGLTPGRPPEVEFAAFGSGEPVQNLIGSYKVSGGQLVENSPYARAYALATRLAGQAATPYAFVRSVERYLSTANGFHYDQNPPLRPYPIESFLFDDKRGYCQQFAGAMALLLRMGGVPARVATGFATGRYDAGAGQYVVSDTDAHAWVEAWFPAYGWVRFDPTPAAAPAIGGPPTLAAQAATKRHGPTGIDRLNANSASSGPRSAIAHRGGSAIWIVLGAGVGLLALVAVALLVVRRAKRPTGDQLVDELERALERCGRPPAGGMTLAALEHRFRSTPAAEGYVRALRLTRFAGAVQLPSAAQRRALRTELAVGLGAVGRLRAWWALPPRFLH